MLFTTLEKALEQKARWESKAKYRAVLLSADELVAWHTRGVAELESLMSL